MQNTMHEKFLHMTETPIRRLIPELALPTIISMLVTSFYNMADTFFVGRINTQATAAVGVVFSFMAVLHLLKALSNARSKSSHPKSAMAPYAKQYASQGQTRTAALAMKLAEREIYRNVSGEYPVLLLDDVLSELDPRRQEFVLNRIAGGQVFITCCEDDRLPQMLGGKVFHVERGVIG